MDFFERGDQTRHRYYDTTGQLYYEYDPHRPHGVAEVRMPNGAIYRVPVQSISQIREIYCWQVYNKHMKIEDLKGKIIFDIGAMAGIYSVMIAIAGAEKVIAVEPNKANYTLLSENIALNKLVTVKPVPLIISDQDNVKTKLYTSPDGPGGHSLILEHVKGGSSFIGPKGDKVTLYETVPSITLDSLAKMNNVIPDFVKMDIEGAEHLAMLGATDLLAHGHTEYAIATYHEEKTHSKVVNIFEQFDYEIKEAGGGYQGDRYVYAWKL